MLEQVKVLLSETPKAASPGKKLKALYHADMPEKVAAYHQAAAKAWLMTALANRKHTPYQHGIAGIAMVMRTMQQTLLTCQIRFWITTLSKRIITK